MKRPQVAEELEEEEVDKLLFLEVLQIFKFYHRLWHFLWLLTFLWLLFVYRRGRGGRTRLFGR